MVTDATSQAQADWYRQHAPRLEGDAIDLQALFGGKQKVELDLGFGRGHSLFTRLAQAPDSCLLGVEVKTKWVCKVHARKEALNLHQLQVCAADARQLLPRLQPAGIVSHCFIHFPDPWWKKRHAKRTVIQTPLLDALARLLAPGGVLFIQTDVEMRAQEHQALLAAHPAFALAAGGAGFVSENPFGSVSNREVRAAADGLPVWRLLSHRVVTAPAR
ncbi:MAG: tRNA (guanosine(46)-N7)-methyltransferase TrmB [Polyangiales bacterium]